MGKMTDLKILWRVFRKLYPQPPVWISSEIARWEKESLVIVL